MLNIGKAIKVSIYTSDGSSHRGVSTQASILDFLFFRGVSGATVLKGVAGFGTDHHLHTSDIIAVSDHLPIKIEFIETREKVDELMGKLEELVGSGMIEVQETMIVKPAAVSRRDANAVSVPAKIEGKAKLMRIYIDEDDRWHDQPLHEALLSAMRANDLAGATVYRGILGYGADRKIHKEMPFDLGHDCSVMLSIIDSEEKMNSIMPLLDKMIQQGFVVLSDVDVIKYTHRALEGTEAKG
ncbi:MAG: DUF190 domain-containing protein [Acidobacteriaceae bacterium]